MTLQVIEIYIVARLSNAHEKTDSIAFCRFFLQAMKLVNLKIVNLKEL